MICVIGDGQALKFYECPGMVLKGLTHLNSQKQHIVITKCHGALISKIKVIAPEDSPNTDGINIASSKNVRVQRSHISTGKFAVSLPLQEQQNNKTIGFIYIFLGLLPLIF